MIYRNKTEEWWLGKWKLERNIKTFLFFKSRNIPEGCKGSVEDHLNKLILKHDELYKDKFYESRFF